MGTLKNWMLVAAICALSGASAHAGVLTVDFDFSTLTALPGQTVTARGTITNVDTAIVDINSCSLTLPGSFSTDDCAVFLSGTGAPLFLGVGESATVDLFVYTPDISAAGGTSTGSFTILGTPEISGYDGDTQNLLVDAPLQVTVAPEPSSFVLFGLTLPILYGLRRRLK